jgi:hypothetical protein
MLLKLTRYRHKIQQRTSKHTTTPFTMARRITALNNNGMKSLQCGRFQEAIHSFHHALECSKSLSLDCDMDSAELEVINFSLNAIDSKTVLDFSPHSMFDIYQTCYALPKVDSFESYWTEVSTIVVYNLGLAHQIAGLSGVEHAESHLKEALRCYRFSMTLFRASSDLKFTSGSYTLVCGILTNMGQIFSHFWDITEAKSCSNHLRNLLASPATTELTEDEGELFYSAVTFSEGACTRAPAA